MNKNSKIFIAGSSGMVGSAIVRKLIKNGYHNLLGSVYSKSLESNVNIRFVKVNLLSQKDVNEFYKKEKPEYVFLAAAKVGGINANNTYSAQFLYENLQIQNNIIHQSYLNKVKKLLFLGSSCIYPKNCPQPIKEEYLLTGLLEQTNEAYAIAKIAGIKMCEKYNQQYGTNFISAMPTNLYGPNDNYNLLTSHVFPALIRKFHEAKINNEPIVNIWGTGKPRREFLHVDDLADAVIFLMKNYNNSQFVNIGWGEDISIKELALLMKNIIGYTGELKYDSSKPDGTYQKVLDTSLLSSLGFKPEISLKEGISQTYQDFLRIKSEIKR
ncbi:MAG: GDP-L-fucose synthase [Chlorobi bacterium]|nr:GDP-L-fucose synthase [Chlorobiota bacterium]